MFKFYKAYLAVISSKTITILIESKHQFNNSDD